jgi:hypothetical protein
MTTMFAFIVGSSGMYRVRAKPSKLDTIQLEDGFNGIGTSACRRVLYTSFKSYDLIRI